VGSIAIWLAAGAGLGTLASAPALVVRLKAAERPAVVAAPAAEPAAARRAEQPQVVAPNAAAPAIADAPSVQAPPAVAAKLRELAPVALAAPTLAEETRVLESAQRALAEGRPGAALSLLGEHERRFPNGALVEERSAARVLSLCALGRVEEAKRAAEAFIGAAPRSPLVPRLRGACAAPKSDPGSQSPAR
jgi:RNA polymerase sigma-70 factor (ECF subfamily)